MATFLATKKNPLRCSKLAHLVKCSMRIYLLMLEESLVDDEGGPAAQIGSLTHAGVAEFHRHPGNILQRKKAAWDAIQAHAGRFPLADSTEVRLLITPYMDDPRNQEAEIWVHQLKGKDGKARDTPMIEEEVLFTLPPHPIDPTGEPIHVWGHLDQIRRINQVPKVCDYKTGKKTGWELIHDHAIQISAYTYGARQLGIKDCVPGPIIRGHGYRTKEAHEQKILSPDGVFFNSPVLWEDVELILENVRMHIGLMRGGQINFGPGPHCTFCEFGGLAGCLQRYKDSELLQLTPTG